MNGAPLNAVPDVMLIIRPHFLARMVGATARMHRNGPIVFTANIRSNSTFEILSKGLRTRPEAIAALLTRMSTVP